MIEVRHVTHGSALVRKHVRELKHFRLAKHVEQLARRDRPHLGAEIHETRMFKRRNHVHFDRRLDHDIDWPVIAINPTIIIADIVYNNIIHFHQAAIRLELFRLVFRDHQIARIRVRMHPALVRFVHDELHLIHSNATRQNRLSRSAIVNETAVEAHQKIPRLQEAVLFGNVLYACERAPRRHHELVSRVYHRADRSHVRLANILLVVKKRTI